MKIYKIILALCFVGSLNTYGRYFDLCAHSPGHEAEHHIGNVERSVVENFSRLEHQCEIVFQKDVLLAPVDVGSILDLRINDLMVVNQLNLPEPMLTALTQNNLDRIWSKKLLFFHITRDPILNI